MNTATILAAVRIVAEEAAKNYAGGTFRTGWTLEGRADLSPSERGPDYRWADIPALDPLRLVSPRREWAVVCPLARLESDGGSIPNALRKVGAKIGADFGRWSFPECYVFHDATYCAGEVVAVDLLRGTWGRAIIGQRIADAILAVAMMAKNANRATVAAVYAGLRIGGRPAWEQHRREGLPAGAVRLSLA